MFSGDCIMKYPFTTRVRELLSLAHEEALRLRHEYVGSEHILLGLLNEGEGAAIAALKHMGVDPREMRKRIEEGIRPGKGSAQTAELPYTSAAKKTLESAWAAARDLDREDIGTEHLLIGLVREAKGITAQVLVSFGVTLERARTVLSRVLSSVGLRGQIPERKWTPVLSG
jgi:ATP-dependent Clp protease ATP-binding subunit ClpC